jgi:hypothetical protein
MEPALDRGQPIATYLVLGPYSLGEPDFRDSWHTRSEPRWDLIGSYEYQPSLIVHLDLYDPRQDAPDEFTRNQVMLYRLSSGR